MPKQRFVHIEVVFDYDPDHPNDLTDVVAVRQLYSNLDGDSAYEQTKFLFEDQEWRDTFAMAVVAALVGGTTHFRSDEN